MFPSHLCAHFLEVDAATELADLLGTEEARRRFQRVLGGSSSDSRGEGEGCVDVLQLSLLPGVEDVIQVRHPVHHHGRSDGRRSF